MQLKAGTRLKSAVCETQVMVVKAPAGDVDLTCGGAAMIAIDADAPPGAALDPDRAGGTLLGKRYADDDAGLELLCTKPGAGSLWLGTAPLAFKQAKALPSSD